MPQSRVSCQSVGQDREGGGHRASPPGDWTGHIRAGHAVNVASQLFQSDPQLTWEATMLLGGRIVIGGQQARGSHGPRRMDREPREDDIFQMLTGTGALTHEAVGGRLEDDARGDLDLERRRNCQISTPAISNAIPKPAITSRIVERVVTCDPAGLARPSVSFHYFAGWQEIVWSQVKAHAMSRNIHDA